MTLANAHALFLGLKHENSFKRAIHIDSGDDEDRMLRQADGEIRAAIRRAFDRIGTILESEEGRRRRLVASDKRAHEAIKKSNKVRSLDVRFLRQGSFAYRTLIRPAQCPPQELDLDDGVYVPVEFVGGVPIFPSAAFFYVIEQALEPLLREHPDWELETKDTCVRVSFKNKGAHIDLPLFAVDEDEFRRIEKNLNDASDGHARVAKVLNEHRRPGLNDHYRVQPSAILRADREKDWEPSDPKKFQDWFETWADGGQLGPVLRRVAMYGKAWRDHHFEDSALSSMAIMVSAVAAISAVPGKPADNRDDELALLALKRLRSDLNGEGIFHPLTNTRLDANIDDAERDRLTETLDRSIKSFDDALNITTNAYAVVKHLRSIFGERLPDLPEAVDIKRAAQVAAYTEEKAATVPHPKIMTSHSG